MLYKIIRPLLFLFDAEFSHKLTLTLLKLLHVCGLGALYRQHFQALPAKVMGIDFPNRMGLAAGLDKNGDYIDALAAYGFGFVEIGTVTPKPQIGNPKPRLFRLKKSKAIINRMGFNNKGVDYLVARVKQRKSQVILGINIGKNATTAMEDAVKDYLICLRKVYPHADYITANISSPNTKNLRDLQAGDALLDLLKALKAEQAVLAAEHNRYVPIAVKVAPDLSDEQIAYLANAFLKYSIDAVIATNTSIGRAHCLKEKALNQQGGLSGQPIFEQANHVLAGFKKALQGQIPLIGVGGVMSESDAALKLTLGAELVQVYTGLVYGF